MSDEFIKPQRCALVPIDLQERLLPVIWERERVVRQSKILLKAARTLHMPMIATSQYAARIGSLVPEIVAELPGITPVDKMEFSCFANREFRRAVAALSDGVDTIILCGVESHICVYQTAMAALQAGFNTWVAADAVSSRTEFNYNNALERLRDLGAVVASTEMIVYELLGRADSLEFKELLPVLK